MSKKKRTHQQTNNESGMLSNVSDAANTAMNSARSTASNNKWILAAIGTGAALAGYLLGTKHGRSMQGRIGETVKDSFDRIVDGATTGWEKVRTTVQDQISSLSEETSEGQSESEDVRLDKLRRVV